MAWWPGPVLELLTDNWVGGWQGGGCWREKVEGFPSCLPHYGITTGGTPGAPCARGLKILLALVVE